MVSTYNYAYNMTAILDIEKSETESIDQFDRLVAYVGDEIRGISDPTFINGEDKYIFFMMMYSDYQEGETMRFELWDANRKTAMEISDQMSFIDNDHLGTVESPMVLRGDGYGPDIPDEIGLSQNFPNPFNPITEIRYNLPIDQVVAITVYDLNGRVVKSLINSAQSAGYHKVIWDGTNENGIAISTGIYFYQMRAGDFVEMKKMVLLK